MFSPWTDRHGEFQIIREGEEKKKKKSHGSFPANQNPIHLNANVNFKGDKTTVARCSEKEGGLFFSSSSLFRSEKWD